jgi:TusA-related sulfurtransferase
MSEPGGEPVIVDARRLLCPLPVIRLQQAAAKLGEGARVRLIATDPGVKSDVPAWCRVHKHRVLALREEGREIQIELEL